MKNLNKIFYTICGSTAVETAIKISIAYHKARGEGQRFRFVGRERAYHGMNIGATSVGGMINNVKAYASVLMPGVVHMRHTHLDEHKFISGQPETGAEIANDLERICTNFGSENIAACIVEPIAGSTGTLVPPVGYLQRLRELCDKHKILLIFDEVITGWGRTGSAFGAQEFGVTPDIMTMAKATTNGIVPFGVVACKEEIYDAVMDNSPKGAIELFHGYTYSGHPIASAAALKTIEIIEEEKILDHVRNVTPYFQYRLKKLGEKYECISDARGIGLLGCLEGYSNPLLDDKKRLEVDYQFGTMIDKAAEKRGLLVRPIINMCVFSPPLIINKTEIDLMFNILDDAVSEVEKNLK